MEQQKLLLIDDGSAKWCNYFGRQLGNFFNKAEYITTIQSSNHADITQIC